MENTSKKSMGALSLLGTDEFITHFYTAGNGYRMFSYIYSNSNTLGNTLENYSTDFQIK